MRELDSEAVLLDVTSGRYFGLNDSGRRIWSLLGETSTIEALLPRLAVDFGLAPEALREEVAALLDQLEIEGLVERW